VTPFLQALLLAAALSTLAALGSRRFGTRAVLALALLALYLIHMNALPLFAARRTAIPKRDARLAPPLSARPTP